MSQNNDNPSAYELASAKRKEYVDKVLNCPSRRKTVVAGPGTGKTFLFKKALANKKNCLTLSFVSSLVEDLSLDLCGQSEVRTLHGFALSALKEDVRIFPKLSKVIEQDAVILNGDSIDFDAMFNNGLDDDEPVAFYHARKAYYGNYYGFSSIIYAAVKLFKSDSGSIPEYEQILVDEFQDFNQLEVSLIDLLADKSPVLLAGDDDQALYGFEFRGASAEHIRQRHDDANTDYASFTLPYCSRCTRVIVESVNDIVESATMTGNLRGRVPKEFRYFDCEKKDRVCELYPRLSHVRCYEKQIAWFIEQQLEQIASEVQGEFSCLLIVPTKDKGLDIATRLGDKGVGTIVPIPQRRNKDYGLLDGLNLLLDDGKSNLGWRIAAEHFLSSSDLQELLDKTTKPSAECVSKLLDMGTRRKVKGILKIVRDVNRNAKGVTVSEEELNTVLSAVGITGQEVKFTAVQSRIADPVQQSSPHIKGLRKIPIKVTTRESSKGLSADIVFITHFDDLFFIKDKNKISDQDICKFIVSLTRAKKKVFLISSHKNSDPTFLKWIDDSRIERL
jgi:hypothetical protein